MQTGGWIPLVISLVAIFISILSALYARRAANEASKANEIALHNEKLKIFKGILELRGKVMAQGVDIKEHELFSFYEYVQLSEFYYNHSIHEQVKDYFDCVQNIVILRSQWEVAESEEKRKHLVERTHRMRTQSQEKVSRLENSMKEHLRLVKT